MTPKFGINSPQTVKHISQKAFFKHALGEGIGTLWLRQFQNIKKHYAFCWYVVAVSGRGTLSASG